MQPLRVLPRSGGVATSQPQTSETNGVNGCANEEYTVGWICAIAIEYVAAQVFLR